MEDNLQQEEHTNYKFKEIKVYSSTEWLSDNRKKYRQVFDRYSTSYVYAELSFYNKLFDVESWDVEVELRCFDIRNAKRQICQLNFVKKVSKFDNVVYIREGWGNKKTGTFWKKGTYYWEALIDGEKVGSKHFYVIDAGIKPDEKLPNPYISLSAIRLYEGQFDDVNEDDRIYLTTFSAGETRYIYSEIVLNNKLLSENWHCELFVKFYNEARELKGQVIRLHNVKVQEDTLKLTAGWGASSKGSWRHGRYTMEVIFMDMPLAIIQFNVADNFVAGLPELISPDGRLPLNVGGNPNPAAFKKVFDQLDYLIGLTDIKRQVSEYAKYIEFLRLRKSKGFAETDRIDIHAVFMGNPGTGKTTVAKMMGQLYYNMGLLSSGHVVEVDRTDLVGEYIGQTAPKTKEIIEKARGGVLFIDEAYALARVNDDTKDFGKEAVEILVKEMSNGKGDLAVIVAGYPKEMKHFIQSNPGLRSRFKHFFEFTDYLSQELIAIAENVARDKEISFSPDAWLLLKSIITSAYRDRDRTFGNARYIHDLLDKAKINMGLRIMDRKNPAKLAKIELTEIQVADILPLKATKYRTLPDIPVDDELLSESLALLDNMIGIEGVKKQIHELVKVVRHSRLSGKSVLSQFSLHTVFVGNPGTGKTTVARILAKIYKALGILERGHMVETDRQGLIAGFVGQTAIKTSERIDEAVGGVLFIDEAYSLSNFNGLQGDFGNEAIQTLLKRMEDQRGEFFLFVAGYPSNMENFLKANPGLSSRFDRTLVFDDYNADQLMLIATDMLKAEGYKIQDKAFKALEVLVLDIYIKRDKYFGNARTIRKLVIDIIHYQNIRIADELSPSSAKAVLTIKLPDIEAVGNVLNAELTPRKGIGFNK